MLIANLHVTNRFLKKNTRARRPLEEWVDMAEPAEWHSILDARQTFPATDAIRGTNLTCFDLAGNQYRLIAEVSYARQEIVIVELINHAEYDRKY